MTDSGLILYLFSLVLVMIGAGKLAGWPGVILALGLWMAAMVLMIEHRNKG
jgi:predicted PurR-regulated permease PerM